MFRVLFLLLFFSPNLFAQANKLEKLSAKLDREFRIASRARVDFPFPLKPNQTTVFSPSGWERNFPLFREQSDSGANETIGADRVKTGGWHFLSLSGNGETIGIWDAGKPRLTHQEFGSRVTKEDTATVADNSHATQVMGAALASGVDATAKSSAVSALAHAYNWTNDESEMAYAAGNGLRLSVHPYAETAGWIFNWFNDGRYVWYADTTISATEDFAFGFYGEQASTWDEIAASAPRYLIVKAAGNIRGRGPVTQPVQHWIPFYNVSFWDWKLASTTREKNGETDGYETISHASVSKNVLTIGSVQKIAGGYSQASDVIVASDSGFGPTDDGRIKPDLVAPGVSLYMPNSSSNSSYSSGSGTSYAAGVAVGAAALVSEHFRTQLGDTTSSAMLKALLIHTAHEAGSNTGPDYQFGWGLLNLEGAIRFISAFKKGSGLVFVADSSLSNGQTITLSRKNWGESPLKITVVWTDPAHAQLSASLNPTTSVLVNDLDIRINDGTTHYPWKLDRNSPASAATRSGDNAIDNVEQILVDSPAENYTLTITHKGTLEGGNQAFALVISSGNPLAESVLAGNSGWRILSWPSTSSFSTISWQNPVQGVDGAPGAEGFPSNLFSSYNGSTWSEPAHVNNTPAAGSGFLHYIFDNTAGGSRELPFTLFSSGSPRESNITVSLHTSGDKFNLVGNPFDAAIDFSQTSANGSIQADAHVWDAALGWKLTSEIDDSIGVFQGFIVENNDASQFTLPVSARISGGRLRKSAEKTGFRIRLFHPHVNPNPDNGFSIEFFADAIQGYDRYDSKKIWPFASSFAALAARQESDVFARLSFASSEPLSIDIPVEMLAQNASGPGEVFVESVGRFPYDLTLEWIDPITERRTPLFEGTRFSESFSASKNLPSIPNSFSKSVGTWRILRIKKAISTDLMHVLPEKTALESIYPNPFNPQARVIFSLANAGFVSWKLIDISGRVVQSSAPKSYAKGRHAEIINATGLAGGVYMFVLESENLRFTKKLTLLR